MVNELSITEWTPEQYQYYSEAVELFQQVLEIPWMNTPEEKLLHLQAIQKIYPILFSLKENEQFSLTTWIEKEFVSNDVKSVMNGILGYITGARGLLRLKLETKDGNEVEVFDWHENDKMVSCKLGDEILDSKDVFVIFRRNQTALPGDNYE